MTSAQICIMIAIIVYLIGMIYIGFRCSKKNNSTDDFYLGGRKLGPFVTAMSAEASDMSSWLLMGLPGVAYLTGISDAGWTAIGLAAGTYINWLIVAKRIRRYTHTCNNSITIPSFFSNRYRDEKKMLQVIAAIFIVIFFIPYTASGFAACGKLFSSLFGVKYLTAMIISAIVIVAYTTLGGFLAASTTDFIQSIIMSVALIVVLIFGVETAGGIGAVIHNASELPGYLSMTLSYDVNTGNAAPYSALTIVSTAAWGLGYFGMPHILLRFMAIEDEKKLKLSRRVATIWVVISLFVAVFIGVIGYTMSKVGATGDADRIEFRNHYRKNFRPALPARCDICPACGCDSRRHFSFHHVHFGLAAAGCIFCGFFRHSRCFPQRFFQQKRKHGSRKNYTPCNFCRCRIHCQKSGQFRICHRFFRLGWIRCRIRTGCSVFPVLETYQQMGRTCRYGLRWFHGIYLEIPDPPTWWYLEHL